MLQCRRDGCNRLKLLGVINCDFDWTGFKIYVSELFLTCHNLPNLYKSLIFLSEISTSLSQVSTMEHKRFVMLFICFFFSALHSTGAGNDYYVKGFEEIEEESGKAKLLFAFGDSYADTGNLPIPAARPWKTPYGVTFPGKPSGRFSDGRVLTDYIAAFVGARSPPPYQRMKNLKTKSSVQNGINFAHGGTGVFPTLIDLPNMTTQIDFFEQLINRNAFTTDDLSSSVALVSVAGNDYAAYLARNGNFQGLGGLTRSVINQVMVNIRRLNRFGIKKILVTGVGPIGCLPQTTASISFKNCNAALNNFSISHNQLLEQNIWELNYEAAAPLFTYLDLYSSFMSALGVDRNPPGDVANKLKPCCDGDCGGVDENGKKKYVVCEDPNRSVFWDSIHPSDSGWNAVYSALSGSLRSIMN